MQVRADLVDPPQTDESRWQAVLGRDQGQDGTFVYAVATTRIYCRPSCPSRRPGRAQVSFYSTPDAAEAAGYRACLRCEPRSTKPTVQRQVEQAQQYLDQHATEPVTLDQLSSIVGLSPFHLQRSFKRLVGVTPKAYASARRLERMKTRLRKGDTVSQATYDAGYGSGSRAYEHAQARLGMTPGAYREGGRGMRVRYTLVPTSVGLLLAAATERGLCAVALGDEAGELEAGLRREYPAAAIERDDSELQSYIEGVVGQLTGGRPDGSPGLDVKGSAFQWQVWEALRRIPAGETRSYQAIARALGRPAAARAVARACASNRLALVIPCHRVVREDGGLGGYRWGVERKRALLEQERAGRDSPGRVPVPVS
ncbi:MAG TPA: bifunctional DNA-binding transcriptional regulator/O6-methylguanine-DNA methyltransferase Ada [Gemmatimonadales bacterium]